MIGMDLLESERFDLAIKRSGEAFAKRILTNSEMKNNAYEKWAVIFSAKESCIKLIGGMPSGASFLDIQILFLSNTSFTVKVLGEFAKSMEAKNIKELNGEYIRLPVGLIITTLSCTMQK